MHVALIAPSITALEWAASQQSSECGGATKNDRHRVPLQTLNVLRPPAAAAPDVSARETVVWQGANIARGPSLLLAHRPAATADTTAAAVVPAPTVASPPSSPAAVLSRRAEPAVVGAAAAAAAAAGGTDDDRVLEEDELLAMLEEESAPHLKHAMGSSSPVETPAAPTAGGGTETRSECAAKAPGGGTACAPVDEIEAAPAFAASSRARRTRPSRATTGAVRYAEHAEEGTTAVGADGERASQQAVEMELESDCESEGFQGDGPHGCDSASESDGDLFGARGRTGKKGTGKRPEGKENVAAAIRGGDDALELEGMTVVALKVKAKAAGLAVSGTKAVLIARLRGEQVPLTTVVRTGLHARLLSLPLLTVSSPWCCSSQSLRVQGAEAGSGRRRCGGRVRSGGAALPVSVRRGRARERVVVILPRHPSRDGVNSPPARAGYRRPRGHLRAWHCHGQLRQRRRKRRARMRTGPRCSSRRRRLHRANCRDEALLGSIS